MKKVLYATTALVALGMAPFAAQAQDKKPAESPIVISVGGYFNLAGIFAQQDDGRIQQNGKLNAAGTRQGTVRPYGISRESEIHFKGETTLNNGLKVGVQVELEGETSADQIDNTYIYFQHADYGRVILGEDWGSGLKVAKGTVGHINGIGTFSHFAGQPSFLTGTNSITAAINTIAVLDGVNDKVVYDTPRIAGFRGSVSFTPDDKATASGIGAGESGVGLNNRQNGFTSVSDVWTIGGDYVETFGPIGVQGHAVYQKGYRELNDTGRKSGNSDPNSYAFGLELSFEGLRFGGAYKRINNNAIVFGAATVAARGLDTSKNIGSANAAGYTTDGDRSDFTVGTDYTFGPWTVGATYGFATQSGIRFANNAGAAGQHRGTDRLDQWTLGASYALGPGISLYGGYLGVDLNGASNGGDKGGASNNASVFVLGTRLVF